jgi:hypothetical protein
VKKVLIVGSEGSIGRRYKAVVTHCDALYIPCDKRNNTTHNIESDFDMAIVASPTDMHAYHVTRLLKKQKPILCEKPLGADMYDVRQILGEPGAKDLVYVVDNWSWMIGSSETNNRIIYKNFFTGSENIAYNLAQPIYLSSTSRFKFNLNYPYFEAIVNDKVYTTHDVDRSYVKMIHHWLRSGKTSFDHNKSYAMQEALIQYMDGNV